MQLRRLRLLILIPCLAIFAMAGCNIFTPFDDPTNDDQLQSAARACFDNGDLTCALQLYTKLEAGRPDTALSESAFAILDENGLSMAVLMSAVGSGGSGAMLNTIAAALAPSAGLTKRMAIYTAYETVASISNSSLRGLVRFITGLALASEILAEQITPVTSLLQTNIVSNPTNCFFASSGASGCIAVGIATPTQCAPTGTAVIVDTTTTIDIITAPTSSATVALMAASSPNWEMIYASILAIEQALGTSELGASGKFSSGAGGFTSSVGTQAAPTSPAPAPQCFRALLVSLGVGVKS